MRKDEAPKCASRDRVFYLLRSAKGSFCYMNCWTQAERDDVRSNAAKPSGRHHPLCDEMHTTIEQEEAGYKR